MPPRRRPAAAIEAGADRARLRRRPAAVEPPADLTFATGGLIGVHQIPIGELLPGTQVYVEGSYWGNSISFTGEVAAVSAKGGQLELTLVVSGTSDESFLRWASGQGDKLVRCHLCHPECGGSPEADDYIHAKAMRLLKFDPPSWSQNLKEAGETDVFRRMAEESARKMREEKGKGTGTGAPRPAEAGAAAKEDEEDISTSEESKKKKKKKKKRKKKAKAWKVEGKKPLDSLFNHTGLDPVLKSRQQVMKKARRAMRKKTRGESTGSSGSSTSETSSAEIEGSLFEEGHRIRRAATKGPGALACYTVENMAKMLLTWMCGWGCK